jgi:hypothetical protein
VLVLGALWWAGRHVGRPRVDQGPDPQPAPGDTILLSASRTLQVVRIYHNDADGLPVLVVEDLKSV